MRAQMDEMRKNESGYLRQILSLENDVKTVNCDLEEKEEEIVQVLAQNTEMNAKVGKTNTISSQNTLMESEISELKMEKCHLEKEVAKYQKENEIDLFGE